MTSTRRFFTLLLTLSSWLGCATVERPPPPENDGIHSFAQGCYSMDATRPGSSDTRWLTLDEDGERFVFSATTSEEGTPFFLKPSDLGTYLFYDADEGYLIAQEGELRRTDELLSDVMLVDDAYQSPAEWELMVSVHDPERFQLRHLASGLYLTRRGLTEDEAEAAVVALYPREGCAEFPELTLDAEGVPEDGTFDDGDVWGFVDTHSHIMTNLSFGGGGIFHGAPFHRLGVEHALGSCEPFHGAEGRRDIFGFGYDEGGGLDADTLVTAFVSGRLPEFNHFTEGYPDFTEWPAAPSSATHQTQYYRWLQRAYLAGLRLMIQHATSNSVICDLMVGSDIQPVRYSCNDMVATDRIIAETYAMERYIDAQEGGPGRGWFRVVTTPEDARRVISEGKLAIVLGIEVSNLFDCFVTPPDGFERCDEAELQRQLDHYYDLGIRVMFPVHKYDNGFSGGDGNRDFIELGNWINSSHWSNFTQDCNTDVPTVFDRGSVNFGGLNMPREEYFAPPAVDLSGFGMDPVGTVGPYLDQILAPPLEGDYCQTQGLTELGESLLVGMMERGMIIEIDHFNRRAYARAFELLEENDYPAAGTHGTNYDGRLYALGGVSKAGFGRCADPERPGAMLDRFRSRWALIEENGGYPSEGFGFDLNGLAGAPRARFGERSRCSQPQENPITYPFTSYRGDVTFSEPRIGNRTLDFNTEGMVHIGLVPELIEDARRTGVTDEDLEPLFRSAEAYLRMWERAEERAAALR